jgi:hypothetical protein
VGRAVRVRNSKRTEAINYSFAMEVLVNHAFRQEAFGTKGSGRSIVCRKYEGVVLGTTIERVREMACAATVEQEGRATPWVVRGKGGRPLTSSNHVEALRSVIGSEKRRSIHGCGR